MKTDDGDSRSSADQALATDLVQRLLRRHTDPLGVIDVRAPQRLHARTAGWVAKRFSLLGHWKDRYDTETARDDLTFTMPSAELNDAIASYTRTGATGGRVVEPKQDPGLSSLPQGQFRVSRRALVAPSAAQRTVSPQTPAPPQAEAPLRNLTSKSEAKDGSASSRTSAEAEVRTSRRDVSTKSGGSGGIATNEGSSSLKSAVLSGTAQMGGLADDMPLITSKASATRLTLAQSPGAVANAQAQQDETLDYAGGSNPFPGSVGASSPAVGVQRIAPEIGNVPHIARRLVVASLPLRDRTLTTTTSVGASLATVKTPTVKNSAISQKRSEEPAPRSVESHVDAGQTSHPLRLYRKAIEASANTEERSVPAPLRRATPPTPSSVPSNIQFVERRSQAMVQESEPRSASGPEFNAREGTGHSLAAGESPTALRMPIRQPSDQRTNARPGSSGSGKSRAAFTEEILTPSSIAPKPAMVWRVVAAAPSAGGVSAGAAAANTRGSLPLATTAANAGDVRITRQPSTGESASSTSVETTSQPETGPVQATQAAPGIDITELSEQVGRLIARELAAERERRGMK